MNKTGETLVKRPGSLNGYQFVIESCTDCTIYLLDWTDTITVDDCHNCKFFIGPVSSSFFLRESTNCSVVVAAGQFRTRDVTTTKIALFTHTRPVIESSSGLSIGCYPSSPAYPELESQFAAANLSVWTNPWWRVHDFTPPATGQIANWNVLSSQEAENLLPSPPEEEEEENQGEASEVQADAIVLHSKRVVPYTEGRIGGKGVCFVLAASAEVASSIIEAHPDGVMQTKQVKLNAAQERLMEGAMGVPLVKSSSNGVVGLELNYKLEESAFGPSAIAVPGSTSETNAAVTTFFETITYDN